MTALEPRPACAVSSIVSPAPIAAAVLGFLGLAAAPDVPNRQGVRRQASGFRRLIPDA